MGREYQVGFGLGFAESKTHLAKATGLGCVIVQEGKSMGGSGVHFTGWEN